MSESTNKNAGWGCLAAMGTPFFLVGLVVLGLAVRIGVRWLDARGWEEVPASILQADLKVFHGDGSKTYEATAEYSYEYAGRRYESDSVSLHSGADNIGSYQQDLADELKRLQQIGKGTVCYVDPDDPERALLRRDFRFGLVFLEATFGTVFAVFGGGLFFSAAYVRSRDQKEGMKQRKSPEEPWLWRDDWAAGFVRPSTADSLIGAAVFCGLWNLISWPIALMFLVIDRPDDNHWAWLVALFPAVGIGLLSALVYQWLRYQKWKGSTLELASVPCVVGGRLAGVVHAPGGIDPNDGFQLTLTCIQKTTRSSGDGEKQQDEPIWQDDRVVVRELLEQDPTTTAIPVQFHVPFEAEPTSSKKDIRWELSVHASVPGIDYREVFELPVFKTEQSSPDLPAEAADLAEYQPRPTLESALAGCGATLHWRTEQSLKVSFARARNKVPAVGLTLFTALWTAVCIGLFLMDFPLFFPIVFTLFDLLLLYAMLDQWLDRREFEVDAEGVRTRGGWFSLGSGRSFPREVISDIVIDHGMRSGNKLYHRLVLWMPGDKSQMLCSGIPRRSTAQLLRDEIVGILRLEPSDS